MNEYVISFNMCYDDYYGVMHFPIKTTYDRDAILAELEKLYLYKRDILSKMINEKIPLLDTNLILDSVFNCCYTKWNTSTTYSWIFVPPDINTLSNWFQIYTNI